MLEFQCQFSDNFWIYSCANLTMLNIDITSCQMAMSYILGSSCTPRLHSSVLGYVYDLRSSFIRWLKVRGTPRGASWIASVQTNFEDEAKTLLSKKYQAKFYVWQGLTNSLCRIFATSPSSSYLSIFPSQVVKKSWEVRVYVKAAPSNAFEIVW